jgi:hypothetical protein
MLWPFFASAKTKIAMFLILKIFKKYSPEKNIYLAQKSFFSMGSILDSIFCIFISMDYKSFKMHINLLS